MLADFGAEVIKVQSAKMATGIESNTTPYFCAWNRNKRSITLDMDHHEAREIFLKLVKRGLSRIRHRIFAPGTETKEVSPWIWTIMKPGRYF
jgi:crotonobetainyl-CoA:carnitine CoA-transferase CaiB-like acyl-CoA transferase